MKYRFILTYQATDSETTSTRTCFPLHSDDLSISIDRESDEWYYTRKLDGKLVFVNADYAWIMDDEYRPFDGTFTLDIKESHDNGATWFDYFTGTFSRASLEIDEDNKKATLNGLKEGVEDLIKSGKNEDYDLMKLIPDSYTKEVQGQVPPALAMVDYRTTNIEHSDVFCDAAFSAAGYDSKHPESGYDEYELVDTDNNWALVQITCECRIVMSDTSSVANGLYAGLMDYHTIHVRYPSGEYIDATSVFGWMNNNNGCRIGVDVDYPTPGGFTFVRFRVYDQLDATEPIITFRQPMYRFDYSPSSIELESGGNKMTAYFHYIRATLLTQDGGNADNVLDTGDYYKRMSAFNNIGYGLRIEITTNTVEQPNGHRLVPGTGEQGTVPQYFAPPDETEHWIPLCEYEWQFASMWYTIQPSDANGLTDPAKFGSFRWTRCWTIGCCIMHLLKRITNDKVVFSESTGYSQFLYGNPNPVEGHEPFQWLVTQKSNVMHPAAGGASRCIVRLDWFFELLRNAFNCYYWFERRNDGRYNFRIEHVEYFRRGGAYNRDLADQLDLTRLKPYRNFLRNGQPAKRYADQTNRYTFDLDGMVEKYTYSWQGDGGGDDFRGNPMYFKAGWIEKGSIDDRQVDNIFADLGWLMLNAGTATESSKNYDGLFIFGGYQPFTMSQWKENAAPMGRYLFNPFFSNIDIWATVPAGQQITVEYVNNTTGTVTLENTYTGTGSIQQIQMRPRIGGHNITYQVNFGTEWHDVLVHRIHLHQGNLYYTPKVEDKLQPVNYLQNGCLAWPWLQCEYLHYDIPAAKWTYLKDDYTDNPALEWETDGTIKLVKKQSLAVVPVPDASTEEAIINIMGIKTGLGIGIIDSAKISLSSRNAEMTIIYDINPQNN